MAVQLHNKYVLGEFELEPDKYLLKHHNERIHLPELPFKVLLYLVENRERYVSRQELLERFWSGSQSYEETLTKCISTIRTELNDPPPAPRFIETRKKVGYRYIGPFQEVTPGEAWVGIPAVEIEKTRGVKIVIEEDDETYTALVNEKVLPAPVPAETPIKLLGPAPSRRTTRLFSAISACAVIALIAGGFVIYRFRIRATPSQPPSIHSLAVLPLENMSGDPTQDYFADGMTEALITEMSKISALRVISRTSVMQYKGARKPLPEIARELHVDGIVEGAVIRSGGRVRITAQLINATTDQHVWAESYERDLSDVLSLQGEVARGIANQINITLTRQEETLLANKAPINPAASEAYLKGLYYSSQARNLPQLEQKKQSVLKSIEYYQQAIKAQPDYALAYAGLARAYNGLAASQGLPGLYPKAKEMATKAVQLDDSLAEAHTSLGFTIFNSEWDWPGAERQYQRGIQLNPSYSQAHVGYSIYLSAAERHAEAIAQVKQAEALDPLIISVRAGEAQIYNQAREYDKAIEQLGIVLELSPDDPQAHGSLGLVYLRKGMYPEALSEFQKSSDLSHGNPFPEAGLALVYAETGRREAALNKLKRVKNSLPDPTLSMVIAIVYSALGDKDEAFRWLDRAYQARAQNLLTIRSYPEFDSLRSDSRFEDLMRRIGFPPPV